MGRRLASPGLNLSSRGGRDPRDQQRQSHIVADTGSTGLSLAGDGLAPASSEWSDDRKAIELELAPGESIVVGDYRIEIQADNGVEVTLAIASESGDPTALDRVELAEERTRSLPPR